jgi:hypothetical protein
MAKPSDASENEGMCLVINYVLLTIIFSPERRARDGYLSGDLSLYFLGKVKPIIIQT